MSNEQNESTNQMTQEMGTTERLFGAEEAAESIEVEPVQPKMESKSIKKEVSTEPTKTEPVKAVEPDDEYLPLENLASKKVKVKIGGEEQAKTLQEILKGYQTDQYLTQKGQKLAEEYRALQAAKAAKPTEAPVQGSPTDYNATAPVEDDFTREYIKPYTEVQNKKIAELEQQLKRLGELTGPLEYQSNLNKLAADMKKEGYDDFLNYEPEIRQRIYNMPVEEQIKFDTDFGFKSIYKDIKLAEYKTALAGKSEPKNPDHRLQPKIVNIEGGGGVASGSDDSNAKLNNAFRKAQESGRTSDWAQVVMEKYGA